MSRRFVFVQRAQRYRVVCRSHPPPPGTALAGVVLTTFELLLWLRVTSELLSRRRPGRSWARRRMAVWRLVYEGIVQVGGAGSVGAVPNRDVALGSRITGLLYPQIAVFAASFVALRARSPRSYPSSTCVFQTRFPAITSPPSYIVSNGFLAHDPSPFPY